MHRQLAIVWLRRGAATGFPHRSCIRTVVQRLDRCSYFCVYVALVLYLALLSNVVTFIVDKKDRCHFGLRIRWIESSNSGPKSDLGHRILKSDFIPSDFAISDCIRRRIHSSDRKVKSQARNRILHKNLPYFDVTMWCRVDVVPILPMCPVRGCVSPNFSKCPVPVSMLYRYRYQLRYRRPYRYRRYRY